MTMSAENVARAQEMRVDGATNVAIGEALGVSENTIRYHLNPKHREKHMAYGSAYREAHKEERSIYNASHYVANYDRIAAYRDENREEKNAKQRAWNAENKEKIARNNAAYQATHKEEVAAYNAAYRLDHIPEHNARGAVRRALKAGFLLGATAAQKAAVVEIYRKAKEEPNIRCYLCGRVIPMGSRQVDHVMPLSKGGAHLSSNLEIACAHCNLSKNAKHPNELGILI